MDVKKVGSQTTSQVGAAIQGKDRPAAVQAAPASRTEAGQHVPPASVTISPALAAAATAAKDNSSDPMDAELIASLREQIRSGTFTIDYPGLARSIIEDAFATMQRVPRDSSR